MDKLPFTVYDFFACLSSGLVVLAGLGAAFAGSDRWQQTPQPVVALVLVVVIYGTGHVVANLSGHFYEGVAVRRWLKAPSVNLMAQARPSGCTSRFFPGYFRRLPDGARARIKERAAGSGMVDSGEDLFLVAFAVVKNDPQAYARLSTFLNLYGFCRNVSLAALLASAWLLVGAALGTAHTGTIVSPGWWAAGAFVLAVGLFYRYLKFFRQYAVEVFLTYATTGS
jgi:hypothetical protein